MSSIVQERYTPVPIAVSGTYIFPSGTYTGIGGLLCITAGTITVTRGDGTVVIAAFPVTAGTYIPMPFYVGNGATVVLAGGASGVLGLT